MPEIHLFDWVRITAFLEEVQPKLVEAHLIALQVVTVLDLEYYLNGHIWHRIGEQRDYLEVVRVILRQHHTLNFIVIDAGRTCRSAALCKPARYA